MRSGSRSEKSLQFSVIDHAEKHEARILLASETRVERFLVVFCIAYAANFVALLFFIRVIFVNPGISQILAGGVYIFASYLLNKYYVFRPSKMDC